jgi:peptide-methionine (S)-S-oxide reductase
MPRLPQSTSAKALALTVAILAALASQTGRAHAQDIRTAVVAGGTGHLEVVEITYDADILPYDRLLHLFLRSIDPLDAGGQFCDRGESYTTAIFVETPEERRLAEAALAAASRDLGQQVVTPVRDAATFFPAEAYHQDYYRSDEIILTRFGPRRKSVAYDLYRDACGRDARVEQIWGADAPFIHHGAG